MQVTANAQGHGEVKRLPSSLSRFGTVVLTETRELLSSGSIDDLKSPLRTYARPMACSNRARASADRQFALYAFRCLVEERGSAYIISGVLKRIRDGEDVQRDIGNLLRLLSLMFRLISLSRRSVATVLP